LKRLKRGHEVLRGEEKEAGKWERLSKDHKYFEKAEDGERLRPTKSSK